MAQAQLKPRREGRDWPFQVTPLHPVLGCEITGITLAQAVSAIRSRLAARFGAEASDVIGEI